MADTIILPQWSRDILARNSALEGAVLFTLSQFQPWIRSSGMPFFPGFTDHSDRHLNEVLATATSLITDDARAHLTPTDVAVLVLSVLLHDSGMHLTEDGFRDLIRPDVQHPRVIGFGDRPWAELWTEFLSEASRFDGRTLRRIFGNDHPVDTRRLDVLNLKDRDKLLIGEFVRRHHARLAHEIALWGVPRPTSERIRLEKIPEPIADLAGLVARSHNLNLRSTYDFLKQKYAIREFQGVHAVFLMAVLRIADYLQVHSERANKELLRVKSLVSPLSRAEWATHHSIRDIQSSHEDPEALFIDAAPESAAMFVKLRRLLNDIQDELDKTWAALGEVYGRYPPFDALGLTVRRVRSNLDDSGELQKRLSYVPAQISFESAGTDLLRLLVVPLYGAEPGVGIRELIQNAVDASRERTDWAATHRSADISDQLYPISADVEVLISETNDGKRFAQITDRGIGMNIDIVRNYFLKAGASFRTSEAWKREHEDDSGRSRVLRGGRFGVGALAAFLIGDEITVTTRRIDEPADRALHFSASLDAESIEIQYVRAPIGTMLSIPITSEQIWEELTEDVGSLEENDESIEVGPR